MSIEFKHIPVLLNETVNALEIKESDIIVDCTAGAGGHSAKALEKLKTGMLVAVDQDPQAIGTLNKRFAKNDNVKIIHDNFSNLSAILSSLNIERVDGIMADLGVSSHQLDDSDRGFSFHKDAPLDMRMSMQGISAKDVVNTYPQRELQRIIYSYGEEKYASSISKNIIKARDEAAIETTFQLVDIIKRSMPASAKRNGHPARKTFQALRIEVNSELDRLENSIDVMFDELSIGARLAIITFHSLEDRIVKKKFASYCVGCTCPPEFPVCVCGKVPRGKIPFKSVSPSEKEIEENARSRSARLRVIEKINK